MARYQAAGGGVWQHINAISKSAVARLKRRGINDNDKRRNIMAHQLSVIMACGNQRQQRRRRNGENGVAAW